MADLSPQAAVGGCLARVFSLFGFFLLATGIFATVRNFDDPGGGFAFAGSVLPGLALIALGRMIRRRVNRSVAESVAQADVRPPTPAPRPLGTTPSAPVKTQPPRPVPIEIAEILEDNPPDAGLERIEDLSLDDFRPGQPLSSEERIKQAREKYNKKP